MNLVDTSGWLEYFAETNNAINYEKVITQTEKLIVPTIIIYEVFKKISHEYDENKALIAIAHMKLGKVINLDETKSKLITLPSFICAIAISAYEAR